MTGLTYSRFFPSDWRTGCYVLDLEEEGLYIRCCAWMWDTGQPVPGDDSIAAKLLNVQILKYKKVMGSLIAKGKMIRAQGVIINERVVEEIDAYRQRKTVQSEKAKAGHATRKENSETIRYLRYEVERLRGAVGQRVSDDETGATPHHTPHHTAHHTPPVSVGVTPPVTPIVVSEKLNENNETDEAHQSITSDNPEARSQKPEEEEIEVSNETLVDRKAINRVAAKKAFAVWQDLARRLGLTVPRDTTFETYGKKIAARMFEHAETPKGEAEMLAVWSLAMANVERSKFLRGMANASFRADLKFLCQRESFAKLIDGGYGNGAHAADADHGETYRERMARLMGISPEPESPRGLVEILPPARTQ